MTILKLAYLLILMPYVIGILVTAGIPKRERTPGAQYLSGFFLMLAVFQLFAVPAVLKEAHIEVLVRLYLAVTTILVILALLMYINKARKVVNDHSKSFVSAAKACFASQSRREWIATVLYWCLFVMLVGYQLHMAYRYASFDGDDAYYVAQSVMAQQSGSMYEVNPYTGAPTPFDARHATATVTMWIAVIAQIAGAHATVVSHTVLPLIILPAVYLLYIEIGRRLVKKKSELPIFMLFIALLQMFGYVSLYTKETFLMTRTWQGKAMAGNLVFPAILWLLLTFAGYFPGKAQKAAQDTQTTPQKAAQDTQATSSATAQPAQGTTLWGYFVVLVCVNFFAAMCSSLAAFLAALMTGIFGLVLSISKKSVKLLIALALSCIPCVIYMGLYVILK